MIEGYVKVWRRYFHSSEWLAPRKFSRQEAYIDLVAQASFADRVVQLGEGRSVVLYKGEVLASQLSTKLQSAYDVVGIKKDSCSFTFNDDDTFSATLGKRTLTGTYTYDAATFAITLNFESKLLKLGSMSGYAYISGTGLDLVFDCTRLMKMLTVLGSKVSLLNSITSLMEGYDKANIGFSFTKNK
jgi:hypothetical protein